MAMPNTYQNYGMLRTSEREGVDYRICVRRGRSGLAVMAPHGGDIEPGTSEVASAVAADEHTLYLFEGTKSRGNRGLHLSSTLFDEPHAVDVSRESETIVTIHGCADAQVMVLVGGLADLLVSRVQSSLAAAGFQVESREGLGGIHPENLCNRGRLGAGVQIELSSGLRKTFFLDLTRPGRRRTTTVFDLFAAALRSALSGHEKVY